MPEITRAEAKAKDKPGWELIYKLGATLNGNYPPKLYLGPLALLSLDTPSLTLPVTAYLQKMNIATELAVKAAEGKAEKMLEEMLPPHYLEYREVFEKRDFDTLPKRRPWDHVIEKTPNFKPTNCKVYPLTGDEQKALKEFLDENLHTK